MLYVYTKGAHTVPALMTNYDVLDLVRRPEREIRVSLFVTSPHALCIWQAVTHLHQVGQLYFSLIRRGLANMHVCLISCLLSI